MVKTNNPYRSGLSLILRRLQWDLQPESWRSRKRLKRLLGAHPGRKAVVLCNGPSLLKTDLSVLNGFFTFGLNKINLLFPRTSFRPSCVVAVNPFVLEQNKEFYRTTDLQLFLDRAGLGLIPPRDNITYLHSTGQRAFAQNCSMSIYQSHTVTFVALQLAFHMGFTEVALVGCDHNFAVQGPANKTVVSQGEDRSHFDPNYFGPGTKWQLPDLFESEVGYTMALKAFEEAGRKLVNCTHGGKLEIFPRMSLKAFLAK
jgi:hypothetical protein